MMAIIGTDGIDKLEGGEGYDEIDALGGGDLAWGDGNVRLIFDSVEDLWDFGGFNFGADEIYGGTGSDGLIGDVSHVRLQAYAADPVLVVKLGDDRIFGEEDTDQLYGDAFRIDAGGDTNIHALVAGNDLLNAGAGNDTVYGDASVFAGWANAIHGGDDEILGVLGQNTLVGDAGTFWVRDVWAWFNGGEDDIYGGSGKDLIAGDALELIADAAGRFSPGDDEIIAGGDDDRVFGDVKDAVELVDGAHINYGDDSIEGQDGADNITGDAETAAASWHFGPIQRAGTDIIDGGDGRDVVIGDFKTLSFEGAVDASLSAASTSRFGGDTLGGGDGADLVIGDVQNFTYKNGWARDHALTPDDHLPLGNDTIAGDDGDDELIGDLFKLVFDDGGLIRLGDDKIEGGDDDDILIGDIKSVTDKRGVDLDPLAYAGRLSGGNDTLDGGDGNDTMIGGFGDDTFIKRQGDDHDIIEDFEAGGPNDRIDVIAFGYGGLADVLDIATDLGIGVQLDFGLNSSVVLENVASGDLTAQDFLF